MGRPALEPHAVRRALAILAALLVALPFLDGGLTLWRTQGLGTFGRPTLLGPLVWLAAAAAMASFALATDRLSLARRMILVVTGLSLFGGSVVPATPGLIAAFCGATLCVAAPFLRLGPLGWTSLSLLLLCLPACLTTRFPGGVSPWLVAMAPHLTLALALPGLLPGQRAVQAAKVVVAVSALVCLAGLASYLTLSQALDLPLASVAITRLRLLGHHPNLVVPGLALAILLAAALAVRPGARWERWAPLPLLGALAMISSRTGWLAVVAGLGLLALLRLLPRWRARLMPWLRGLALLAVLAALLVPALGLTDRSISHQSSQTLTKAVTFRASMWRLGRENLAAAPWTGNGPGTHFLQNAHVTKGRYDVLPAEDHPHNTVLAVGASFGWPGLVALAILLGVTLRRPRHGGLLADGASAALFVTWAANGIDMGGATATLFPSSAFLLAALVEASGREPADGSGAASTADKVAAQPPRNPVWRWAFVGFGAAVIVAGLGRARALSTLRDVADTLTASAEGSSVGPLGDVDVGALDERLAGAAGWLPGDHRVPLLRSNLATMGSSLATTLGSPATTRSSSASAKAEQAALHLSHARELAPDLSRLAHLQALQLARADVTDPQVRQLLHEAERLAPFGPEAWRLHMDLAGLAAHHGEEAVAFDELLAALAMSPTAITRARFDARRRILRLDAGHHDGVDIPLAQVSDALKERARQIEDSDPAYAVRLRLALTQALSILGEDDQAEAEIRLLFPDQPLYAMQQRTTAALDREDFDEALSLYHASGPTAIYQIAVERLMAQARATAQDDQAFAAALAAAMALLPDILFEKTNVAEMLRARQVWAERCDDTESLQRLDSALAWLGG